MLCFDERKEIVLEEIAKGRGGLLLRMPTKPLASAVLCADSMFRAFLSFPCLVDSRIISPFHINLYQ